MRKRQANSPRWSAVSLRAGVKLVVVVPFEGGRSTRRWGYPTTGDIPAASTKDIGLLIQEIKLCAETPIEAIAGLNHTRLDQDLASTDIDRPDEGTTSQLARDIVHKQDIRLRISYCAASLTQDPLGSNVYTRRSRNRHSSGAHGW